MRKYCIVLAMALLVGFSPAYALNFEDVKAGITPDNPLWALDKALEKIELAFTFNKAKKVEKRIEFAEERLAEAQEMVAKNKTEHAVKALEDEEKELAEAQKDAAEAGDIKGIDRAIQAIEEHKTRIEQHREEILAKLPEDSPAREKIEEKFERIEEHASATVKHLEEVKAKKSERVKAALAIVTKETGIDAEREYERLMSEGRVSENTILKAIEYANRQIEKNNISLAPIEGDVIQVDVVKDDTITQSIVIAVYKNQLKYVTAPTTVDYTMKVEVVDIPEIIEKAQTGDVKWLLAKLGRVCGTNCVDIAKSLITSSKVSVETKHSKTEVEHGTETNTRSIVSKITGGRIEH